jgi:hypothetical protein
MHCKSQAHCEQETIDSSLEGLTQTPQSVKARPLDHSPETSGRGPGMSPGVDMGHYGCPEDVSLNKTIILLTGRNVYSVSVKL